MEWINNLWNKNKGLAILLGVVLLPITALIIFYKFYSFFNLKSAETSLKNTEKKDETLKQQEEEFKKQANAELDKANDIAKQIEKRHESEEEVDLDWHTKRKD